MSRIAAALIAILLAVPSAFGADAPPARLNLLLITADDMNADSPGWMGNKLGATPNLDAFAGTCHRFINNHVSAPICQPSRSAIMTGRVPHRNGALGFNPINVDVPTMVEVLQKKGYYAAAVNKTVHMMPRTKFPWDKMLEGSGKNPPKMGEDVAACLKAAADAKKPFFINANITDPHRPFPGGDKTKGETGSVKSYAPADVVVPSFLEEVPNVRKEVAEYFTGVRRFDFSFGEVLKALKNSGHEGDTLVLFMSDHGMSFPFSKASIYRNGTWSTVIVKWPGMPVAAEHKEYVSSVDIMPTLLDILGVEKPDGLDGRSWLPLMKGETQPDRDFTITHVNTVSSGKSLPQRCIRSGTRSLMFHAWSDGGKTQFKVEAMSGRSYQALAEYAKTDPLVKGRVDQYIIGTPLSFFDLEKDPDERNNLINDPKYRDEISKMADRLRAHMEKTKDPQLNNFKAAMAQWEHR